MGKRVFWPVAVLCLGAVLAFGFRTHVLWRDEAQAWLVARDAPSFWSLLTGQARSYERHPFVWFGVLRAVAAISTNHLALSTTAYVLALTNGCLILALPLLARWQRVLIAASYFPLFEYGIFARSYALSLTLLLLAVHATRVRGKHRALLVGLCAGLAANTVIAASIPGAIIVLAHSWRALVVPAGAKGSAGESRGARWLIAPGLFLALLLIAKVTTPLAPDTIATLGPVPRLDAELAFAIGSRFVRGFVPIPELRPADGIWWNTNQLLAVFERIPNPGRHGVAALLVVTLGYVLALGWVWALRSDRVASITLAVAFALTMALFVRLPADAVRYEGHLVLCVVVAFLAAAQRDPAVLRGRLFCGLFVLTFGSGTLASGVALYAEARQPFSQSRAVADHIVNEGAAALPIVGFEYYRMAPVAAYLDREFYSPELERVISHGIWSRRWHSRFYETITSAVFHRGVCWAFDEARKGTDVLLVTTFPFAVSKNLAGRMRLEQRFIGSQAQEDYWIYRVRRPENGDDAGACAE